MNIYISAPITGHPLEEVRRKIQIASSAIISRGHTPISPLDICPSDTLTYGECLGRDITVLIDQCEAILMTEGYRFSKGCMIELYVAGVCDKKTYYSEYDIEPVICPSKK